MMFQRPPIGVQSSSRSRFPRTSISSEAAYFIRRQRLGRPEPCEFSEAGSLPGRMIHDFFTSSSCILSVRRMVRDPVGISGAPFKVDWGDRVEEAWWGGGIQTGENIGHATIDDVGDDGGDRIWIVGAAMWKGTLRCCGRADFEHRHGFADLLRRGFNTFMLTTTKLYRENGNR